jgi:urease subunit gamma/beta
MAEINPRLRLDRSRAYGMRPAHATGVTVWLEPGDTVVIPLVPIEGDRVMIGNTGVIDGSLDDPERKKTALETLRECGYLDVVDGQLVNDDERAQQAVSQLMGRR